MAMEGGVWKMNGLKHYKKAADQFNGVAEKEEPELLEEDDFDEEETVE
jgi:hypothetical protein